MPRGLSILLYGIEGIGKTTFALQFPKPMAVLPLREPGFSNLEMMGDVPPGAIASNIKTYEDLTTSLQYLEAKTIVIDSISGFQEMLIEHVVQNDYNGSRSHFDSYSQGLRKTCPQYVASFIDQLEFQVKKGTNIIIIAHRQVDVDPDASGPDTKIVIPYGDHAIYGPFLKWASAILFMSGKKEIEIATKTTGRGDNFQVLEGKAGRVSRMMYTSFSGNHVAKNLLHLPPVIAMGGSAADSYKLFLEALPPKLQEMLREKATT